MEYNVITAEAQQYGLSNDLLDIVYKRFFTTMIETLILLGCLYLSIRVTDYIEKQKQNNNN